MSLYKLCYEIEIAKAINNETFDGSLKITLIKNIKIIFLKFLSIDTRL